MISIKQIEANQVVGIEQAKALASADLKIIANEGNVASGINKIGEVLSSKGGTNIASMLEGLAQSEQGKALIDRFIKPVTEKPSEATKQPTKSVAKDK